MNIIKSLHSGILHRSFRYQGKDLFAVSLLWGFQLDTRDPVLEQDLWQAIGKVLGKNRMLDGGMPKGTGEVLVYGSFFSPGGKPVKGGRVSVTLGSVHKELAVQGDRRWVKILGGSIGLTDPEPFTEMPIVYEAAFGGDGYLKNPVGKGIASIETEAGNIHPLPNIEYPDQFVGSPGDRPEPAGFGPIDRMWEPRIFRAGTYDDRYLETRMPGLPDDIKWTFFNDGASDQWIEGYFKGDEPFEILNMNPEMPVIRGRLPGVYGRCFINHRVNGENTFKEISCSLDTVLFFPGENLGIVVHRGSIEVKEDDAADVKQVMLAHENCKDLPRPRQHYADEFARRIDPEEGFKYMMYTIPLIPQGCKCGFETLQEQDEGEIENLMNRNLENYAKVQEEKYRKLADEKIEEAFSKQEEMIRHIEAAEIEGIDIKAMTRDLEDLRKKLRSSGDILESESSPEEKKIKELIENILPGTFDDPPNPDITRLNMKGFDDFQEYMEKMAADRKSALVEEVKKRLKPLEEQEEYREMMGAGRFQEFKDLIREKDEFKESEELDEIFDMLGETFDLDGLIDALEGASATPEKTAPLPRIRLVTQLNEIKSKVNDAELQLEKMKKELVSLSGWGEMAGKVSDEQLAELKKALGESFGDAAFSEASLDELKQQLEETEKHLAEAEEQAKESYALIAHHIEEGSSPHEGEEPDIAEALIAAYEKGEKTADGDYAFVDLSGQNLSGIDLRGAYLEYADLSHTNLSGSNLSRAILAHADLTGTDLAGANLTGANLGAATLKETRFIDADMTGVILSKSKIEGALFHRCKFKESMDLFLETQFHRADFTGSSLRETNFIERSFTECCFDRADLTQSNFIQPKVEQTSFDGAVLEGVNFIEANLEGTSFRNAKMKNVRFVGGCRLAQADFTGADLREANLRESDLKNADFTSARLDKADFGGSNLAHAVFDRAEAFQTQFIKADLSFARLFRINLMEGNLMKACLSGASFREANLFSASFLHSIIGETDFSGACLEGTILKDWRPR